MPYNDAELIRHLLTCSRRSLGSFILSRMNKEAELRKKLRETLREKVEPIIEEIISNGAEVRWARAIREHGEEIVELAGGPHESAEPYPPRKIAERAKGNSLPKISNP